MSDETAPSNAVLTPPVDAPAVAYCKNCEHSVPFAINAKGRKVCEKCRWIIGNTAATALERTSGLTRARANELTRLYPNADGWLLREMAKTDVKLRLCRAGSQEYNRLLVASASLREQLALEEQHRTVKLDPIEDLSLAQLKARLLSLIGAAELLERRDAETAKQLADERAAELSRPAPPLEAAKKEESPTVSDVQRCGYCFLPLGECSRIRDHVRLRRSDAYEHEDEAAGFDASTLRVWFERHAVDPEWRAWLATKAMLAGLRRRES